MHKQPLRRQGNRVDRLGRAWVEVLERREVLSVDVLTWHYDNARTGANTAETVLAPSNVNTASFGKLGTFATDGYVYAQPLLKTGVSVSGYGTRDVLLVATQHDSVYAFDAAGNNPAQGYLWKTSFLTGPAGTTVTTVPSGDVGTTDIVPEIGITGTPVIDPATNTLYVVAKTKETTGGSVKYVQRLHALDLTNGTEKFGGPVTITAKVGSATFDPLRQNQRPALVLSNGVVYIAWASHGDQGTYHGWVIGYNASNITQQVGAFVDTPTGNQGGIWMAGGGIAADIAGNLFLASGNGTFDANTGGNNYADSVMKLSTSGGLSLSSYFTPYNQATLAAQDNDVGTAACVLLPTQSGATPNELISVDKTGRLYLLNRDSLGGYNSSTNNIVGQLDIGVTIHNGLSYFNGKIYVVGDGGPAKAYSIVNGQFAGLSSSSSAIFGTNGTDGSGAAPSISANGSSNGIVWASNNKAYSSNGSAVLYAFSAANLGTQLWSSSQASGGRDQALPAVKFTTPVVANGRVYLGGETGVTVWGLLSSPTVPAAPTNVAAVANGSSEIDLSWTAPAGPVSSYSIYRSTTPGGEGTTPYRTGVTSTNFADSGLPASSTYYYTVVAANSAGPSAPSAEVSATTSAPSSTVKVALGSVFNQQGIYADGATFPNGSGLDGGGTALSGKLLGTTVNWNGQAFAIGALGGNNVVRATGNVVTLPAGQYGSLQMVVTATNGNQAAQTFVVTYSDNTTATFTQGISDWATPQSFAGESTAMTMAYRNTYTGGRDVRPFFVYGISFALNSSKTVKSITLPNNINVKVLAMDLVGATTPVAPAAPTNLKVASATSSQTSLTWTAPAGAVSSYNIYRSATAGGEGTTPYATGITTTSFSDTAVTPGGTWYYTVAAVNSAGTSPQSNEVSALTPAPSGTVQVPLGSVFNQQGIYADGATFPNGSGLDGGGTALSGKLLGTTVNWNGQAFAIGALGGNNVIRATGNVVTLPAGQYGSLQMLVTATNGNQAAQTFVVTYSDNTTATFSQGISDWATPQSFAGESTALTMAYRNTYTGGRDVRPFFVYGISFALNSSKTVKSITLPNNINVKVLAMDLQ